MKANTSPKTPKKQSPVVHLKLAGTVADKLAEGMKATGLPKATVARLSIERGVDILLKQLGTTTEPQQAA